MSLILIMDQDDAGKKAAKQIAEKCNRTYNVHNIDINYPDVAAMTKEQIQLELIPKIEKLSI
jgi:5S rRNA maturation endonuclease (ribonuclease M5)